MYQDNLMHPLKKINNPFANSFPQNFSDLTTNSRGHQSCMKPSFQEPTEICNTQTPQSYKIFGVQCIETN